MPLNINFQQILLHLFNFVLLASGLYLLLYKPVLAFMQKRQDHYAELDRQSAEKEAAAQAVLSEYEKRLETADEEIKQRAAAANQQLDASRQESLLRAKEQADRLLSDARAAAQQERAAILKGAQKDIAELVVSAAEKLSQKELDLESERALYDRFLEAAQEDEQL
ncbi:hypothetical protein [Beduinella massiliensis]|uniref:F0F1 ATP synthase subunit B family protein n=1 Tax=Beduinella massiliensis TaxID=1852363 RepID=UPI000C8420F9